MDAILVKFGQEELYDQHIQRVFKRIRQYNMRLNPEKCTFRVRADKFLGFYLTERRIEANSYRCESGVQMSVSTSKKEVQNLNDMLTALNRFFSKSAQHALSFYMLLRKEARLNILLIPNRRLSHWRKLWPHRHCSLSTVLGRNTISILIPSSRRGDDTDYRIRLQRTPM